MHTNTITTLGQLQTGDRFRFLRKNDVWQVTKQERNKTHFNKFTEGGVQVFKYDEVRSSSSQCQFLRHTTAPKEQETEPAIFRNDRNNLETTHY